MARECVASDPTANDQCAGQWLVITNPATGDTVDSCTEHLPASIDGATDAWQLQTINVTVTGEPVGE